MDISNKINTPPIFIANPKVPDSEKIIAFVDATLLKRLMVLNQEQTTR